MIVIGKNSFIASDVLKGSVAISHAEVRDNKELENNVIVVFSWSRKLSENLTLADQIIANKPTKIIFISSVTALLKEVDAWNYPRSKKIVERYYQSQHSLTSIIRIGLYEGSHDFDKLVGRIPKTSNEYLRATINDEANKENSGQVINCWEIEDVIIKKWQQLLIDFYIILFRFSKILARCVDVILRIIGVKLYGYSLFTMTQMNKNE